MQPISAIPQQYMTPPATTAPHACHWDLFCRVVDNYGDAGVCWRLARQLVEEHGQIVQLWIDDLETLSKLHPEILPKHATQTVAGVRIGRWTTTTPAVCDADVVIETFACELPEPYLQSMAMRAKPPRWINLEYLSAEEWVVGCHSMTSPHPRLGLLKHFFFPGFPAQTGGLLWGKRDIHSQDQLNSLALKIPDGALRVSLFAYDHVPAHALVSAWHTSSIPVCCLVAPGKPLKLLEIALNQRLDGPLQHGALTLIPMPFLSQELYDQLLQSCDLNFVRGEDSFVRAQWAGKPFVWQIYCQEDLAHHPKLDAFLQRYIAELSPAAQQSLLDLHALWNDPSAGHDTAQAKACWESLLTALSELEGRARKWQSDYDAQPGMAEKLVKFSQLPV